jgi:hypothetical protein
LAWPSAGDVIANAAMIVAACSFGGNPSSPE